MAEKETKKGARETLRQEIAQRDESLSRLIRHIDYLRRVDENNHKEIARWVRLFKETGEVQCIARRMYGA